MNRLEIQAVKIIEQLPVINNQLLRVETQEKQIIRYSCEKKIQELLTNGLDIFFKTASGETIIEMLTHRKYVILKGILSNKFTVHLSRYTKNFTTFTQYTNEKEKTIEKIAQYFQKPFLETLSKRPTVVVTDLGFGDGIFTTALMKHLRKYLGNHPLEVNGIEKQERLVKTAKKNLAKIPNIKEDLRIGDLCNHEIPEDFKNRASIVIASHICYFVNNKKELNVKMGLSAHDDGLGIYIHEKSSVINSFTKSYTDILRPRTSYDVNLMIEKSFQDSGLSYLSDVFDHEVRFPKLSLEEWSRLKQVKTLQFENSFFSERREWHDAKSLLEFFLQDPLESFEKVDRGLLLDGFKELLDKNRNRITMQDKIFFTRLNAPMFIKIKCFFYYLLGICYKFLNDFCRLLLQNFIFIQKKGL